MDTTAWNTDDDRGWFPPGFWSSHLSIPQMPPRGGHFTFNGPIMYNDVVWGGSLAVSLPGLVANLANFTPDRWKNQGEFVMQKKQKERERERETDVTSNVAFGKGPVLPSVNALDAASRILEMTTGTDQQQHLLYPPTKQRPMRASKSC